MALFKYENELFDTLGKIGDCIVLSLLWSVSSLPVVTMGAATSALYHTVTKVVRNQKGTVWKEYWHAFGENFKQATALFLMGLAMVAVLGVGLMHSYSRAPDSGTWGIATVVLFLLLNAAVVLGAFMLFYNSRFIFPIKTVLKNCYLISLLNIIWFLVLWVILVLVPVELCIMINPLIIFIILAVPILPAGLTLLASFVCERIFVKYISPEDKQKHSIY